MRRQDQSFLLSANLKYLLIVLRYVHRKAGLSSRLKSATKQVENDLCIIQFIYLTGVLGYADFDFRGKMFFLDALWPYFMGS